MAEIIMFPGGDNEQAFTGVDPYTVAVQETVLTDIRDTDTSLDYCSAAEADAHQAAELAQFFVRVRRQTP